MNTRTSDPHSLKALRYLPALRDIDYTKRGSLFPLNSSPAKLMASPDNNGRKKLDSSSKPKRVASMPKKSPKELDSTFTRTNFLNKNYGKNAVFTSPRNILNRNNKLAKIETPQKPIKNSPPSTADIFNERFQQLQLHDILPNAEESRCSQKNYGIVSGFGVCTNQGLVRNYNEDRVSIALELQKPISKPNFEAWPNCSIFAIFDGHGGSKCADFLRNHLHYYIIKNRWFPTDPEEALKEACESVETRFLESQLTADEGKHDTSGSCGLVMVIVENTCYVCNVGDSRAVISRNGGKIRQAITRDHKPSDEAEKARVLNAGGRIYQNFPSIPNSKLMSTHNVQPVAAGPQRILPGGLAVSRAFGDIEAKVPKFGGNMNVLIAKPEISIVKINRTVDFIVMGSDGIFDVMSDDEIIKSVWNTIQKVNSTNIHEVLKIASENIIKEALLKKSFDNVTVTIIGFPALEQKINPSSTNLIESSLEINQNLPLSPKVKTPEKIEVIPEVNELPKNLSSPNATRLMRSERFSPQRFRGTLVKTISRDNSRKELTGLKLNETQGKELENFPKIMPRKNAFRQSRLSAM